MPAKKTNIIYWIFTALFLIFMGLGAIPDLLSMPEAIAVFKHLGYPAYLSPFIGAAKLLGVVAILIPGFPRIKEWAYAGFAFDLTGALFSGIAIGETLQSLPILIGYVLLAGSYIFHHKRLNIRQPGLSIA